MLKNKKIFIFCLAALVLIGVAVFAAVQTDVFNSAINTVSHLFSKPIDNVDDIKNAPEIVEMTETQPLDSFVRQINQGIASGEDKWPYTGSAICYDIRYKSDEYTVQGFLCLPDDYLEKEYPILIFNRGGSNLESAKIGSINVHVPYLLSRTGFVVLATQHRGWGEGSGKDEMGGGDIQDVIALVDLAEKFTFSNGKIYMLGWSRGAEDTYMVLSRDDRITAAVAGAGATDAAKNYYEREEGMKRAWIEATGGTPEEVPEEYEKRSAIYWAEKINTPLLIAQGTEDWRVLMHHSVDLYEKMKSMGKDVELQIYEGEDHDTAFNNHLGTYLQWLLEH